MPTKLFAALVVLASALTATAQVPLGSEFRVDTRGFAETFLFPTPRSSAMAADGAFVVAWATNNAGAVDVVARRFDANGVGQGADFLVNSYTTGWQYDHSVGIDDAGNFVVVWRNQEAQDGSSSGVFGQRFDRSATPLGSEFRVNSTTLNGQFQPSVAVAPGGAFVVVWTSPDADSFGVFGQRYDGSGAAAGAEFQANAYTTGRQSAPTVDVDGAGNFVVIWSQYAPIGPPMDNFGQRFTSDGVRLGAEFAVSSSAYGLETQTSIARSRDGSFMVVWYNVGDIFARRFDSSGTPLGADFRVNEYTTGEQRRPEVDADADGDFVVTWTSYVNCCANSVGVFGKRFDSTGVGGGEFLVRSGPTGIPRASTIASDTAGNFVVAWHAFQDSVAGIFAQRYAGGLSAAALSVDGSAGPTSDGNRVFEAGETVTVAPAWLNANFGAETFTGTASSFTGPGAPGDPTYTIVDGTASYGAVASGETGSCTTAADCHAVGASVPTVRPAQHWDATFREVIAPANLGAAKNWTLHIGDSFGDVPRASGFYRFVETLLHHGVTGGCNTTQYCPSASTTREQMAVFVLVAKEGAGYVPLTCTTPVFGDVPATSPFCRWIEELARRGVVAGCGGGNYCPSASVSREQMAVFVLLTKEPGVTPPACGTPMFNDVPTASPFCRWIEELARRGVVAGCGGGNYCPSAPVTREQMAVFISATFGLLLYGP